MNDSQFDIERATNGLVLTLYLASAIFLAVMLYYVLRDMGERQQAAEGQGASSARFIVPSIDESSPSGEARRMAVAPRRHIPVA